MQHLQSTKHTCLCRAVVGLLLSVLTATPLPDARAAGADAAQQQQQPPQDAHVHYHQETPAPQRYTRTVASYTPPDVTLSDMNGEKVTLASALGREGPVILQFIFTTCPTVCPVMSATFSAAQDKLGAELGKVRMISVSIDPEQDTPPRLREYARKFKAGPQWLFLTGDSDDIVAVRKSFDAYGNNKMRHEPLTFLRASPGKRWVRLDGLMSATQLLAEYKRLIAE